MNLSQDETQKDDFSAKLGPYSSMTKNQSERRLLNREGSKSRDFFSERTGAGFRTGDQDDKMLSDQFYPKGDDMASGDKGENESELNNTQEPKRAESKKVKADAKGEEDDDPSLA